MIYGMAIGRAAVCMWSDEFWAGRSDVLFLIDGRAERPRR